MDTRYTNSDFDHSDVSPNEKFIGALDYTNQLNEQWLGLGVAYRVNDHISIGATMFISYRAQSYQLTNYYKLIYKGDSTELFGNINIDKTLKYKTFSGLFKFGAAYQTGNWKFGLTLTTPSIQVYGSGDIQREDSFIAIDTAGSGGGYVIMARKTGIHATYRRPLSIGFGVEYSSEKTRIALSCEYFTRIKVYHLFEPQSDPFVYPESIDTGSTGWDLYHFSAGLSYHQKRNTVTVGFTYSFSPAKSIDQMDVVIPVSYTGNPVVYAQSFGLVIGYTYFFPK